jgi:pyruvate/2-oxoglutarate dehydrogenase complex dihydrolipoamide acyltransferase (E2) component
MATCTLARSKKNVGRCSSGVVFTADAGEGRQHRLVGDVVPVGHHVGLVGRDGDRLRLVARGGARRQAEHKRQVTPGAPSHRASTTQPSRRTLVAAVVAADVAASTTDAAAVARSLSSPPQPARQRPDSTAARKGRSAVAWAGVEGCKLITDSPGGATLGVGSMAALSTDPPLAVLKRGLSIPKPGHRCAYSQAAEKTAPPRRRYAPDAESR